MIVLDAYQKDFITTFLADYRDELLKEGLEIQPIEIKNNLWILPESVLSDPRTQGAKKALADSGHLANMVVREVDPSELIVYDLLGTQSQVGARMAGNEQISQEEAVTENIVQIESSTIQVKQSWLKRLILRIKAWLGF